MFVPRPGQRLVLAIALGVVIVSTSPAVSRAGTLSMTTATTTGPTQNGIFAPAPNDFGTLNLTNNAWIVNTGAGIDPTALTAQFFSMIQAGWDPNPATQGTWDGVPSAAQHSVISSFLPPSQPPSTSYTAYPNAATDPNATTGIGVITGQDYIDNFEGVGTPTFYGVTVTPNMVLMKYTFYGDTNLKGSVDAADIAQGLFGISAHLTGWINDKTDYGTQQATIAGYDIANTLFSKSAQTSAIYAHPLADAMAGGSALSVPEPSSIIMACMAIAAGAFGASRSRNRKKVEAQVIG
jgi:hypothetical protein